MKMRKQRALGAALVVISGIMLALACGGSTVEERDATAVLLTLPLGLYTIFTEDYILYDTEGVGGPGEPGSRRSPNTGKETYNGKEKSY